MQGLLGATFEVAGLSMFVLVVIPKTKNIAMSIGLMNGIFALPIMLHIYAESKNRIRRKNVDNKTSDSKSSGGDKENSNYLRFTLIIISFVLSLLLAAGGFLMAGYEVCVLSLLLTIIFIQVILVFLAYV